MKSDGERLKNIDIYGGLEFCFADILKTTYGAQVIVNAIRAELPNLNTAGMTLEQAIDGLCTLKSRTGFLRFLAQADFDKIQTVIDTLQEILEQEVLDEAAIKSQEWMCVVWESVRYFVVHTNGAGGKTTGPDALVNLLKDADQELTAGQADFEDVDFRKTFSFIGDHVFSQALEALNVKMVDKYGGDAFRQASTSASSSSAGYSVGNASARHKNVDGSKRNNRSKEGDKEKDDVDDAFGM